MAIETIKNKRINKRSKLPLTLTVFSALVAVLAIVAVTAFADADTIYVDAPGQGDYTTINAAVSAASNGDTIVVNASGGPYVETIYINKDINLVSYDNAVIKYTNAIRDIYVQESSHHFEWPILVAGGTYSGANDTVYGPGIRYANISGFEIDGLNGGHGTTHRFTGILWRNAIGSITDCYIHDMYGPSGDGTGEQTFGILVYGDSDLTIEGNTIEDFSRGGIGIMGDDGAFPDPVADVVGNYVYGNGNEAPATGWWAENGIQIGWGAQGSIIGNEVYDCYVNNPDWASSGIIPDADGIVVDDNYLSGNEVPIYASGDPYLRQNIVISNNTVDSNWYGICVANNLTDVLVENNDITNNLYDGIDVFTYGVGYLPPTNVVIRNNLICGNGYDGIWIDAAVDSAEVSIYDNIFCNNYRDVVFTNTTSAASYGPDTYAEGTSYETLASFVYQGDFSVEGITSIPTPPTGTEHIGKGLDITNLTAGTWVNVCIYYEDIDIPWGEDTLEIWKHNGTWYQTGWDNGKSLDTLTNVVCANITGFGSLFAPLLNDLYPPEMTIEVGTPLYTDGVTDFVSCMTPVWFNATDNISGVWRIRPQIQIYNDSLGTWQNEFIQTIYDNSVDDSDTTIGSMSFEYHFPIDCRHRLRMVYADDTSGNRNSTGPARAWHYYTVDCTPPATGKEVGDPKYQGVDWVTSSTPFWLNATDDFSQVGLVLEELTTYNYGFEDFVAGAAGGPPSIPGTWTIYNLDGGDQWVAYSSSYSSHSGQGCARCYYDPANNDWLVSPGITMPASPVDFSLWIKGSSSYPEDHEIYYSTTGNTVSDFTSGTLLYTGSYPGSTWTQHSFSIPEIQGTTVWFAIRYIGTNDFYLYVDDVIFPDGSTEGFEGPPPTPDSWGTWTEQQVTGTCTTWAGVTSGTSPTCSPPEGTLMAKFNSYSCSSGQTRLYSSMMDLTNHFNSYMTFQMSHDTGYTANTDNIIVQASTDGTTWTDLQTIYRYDGSAGWKLHTIDLSAYDNTSSVYVAFLATSDYGNNMYIDDIHFYGFVESLIEGTHDTGIDHIHYELSYEGGTPTAYDVTGNTTTFTLPTEGNWTITWYAVDNVGNIEDINGPQVHRVDNTPPALDVGVGDPKCPGYIPGVEYSVNSDTPIWINITDVQIPGFDPTYGRGVTVYYNITYNAMNYPNCAPGDVYFTFDDFIWNDECDHILNIEAYDDLGNHVTVDPITFHVDDTGPLVPIKTIDPAPVIIDGKSYITGETSFTFIATDAPGDCVCGVRYLYFRVDGTTYYDETNTITITANELGLGEGEHTLEFWAVDCCGNEGTHHTQIHYIDNNPPISYKIFDGPICGNVPGVPGWQLLKEYELIGVSPEKWVNDVIDLSSYAGKTIQLAWRYYSDDQYIGAIDDVQILEGGAPIYSENFDSYVDDGYYTPGPFPPGWTQEPYGQSCSSPTYYKHWGAESYKRHSLPNSMGCYYNCPNDDWVITPEFELDEGGTYSLDYWYFHDDSWDIYLDLYIQEIYEPPGENETEGPVWITSDTEICINAFDTSSGVEILYFEVWWDSNHNGYVDTMTNQRYIKDNYPNDLNPEEGMISYCLTLPEECTHEIRYYATDYFGHVEIQHIEIDHVDNTAPEVNKTFEGLGTLDYLFLNNETVITLEAMDLPGPYTNETDNGDTPPPPPPGDWIYFNDFETDEDGWTVDTTVGDWEWTNTYDVNLFVPGSYTCEPPDVAYSGTGLWGTVMYGPYTNSGSDTTMSQTFDFTGYSNVYLNFASWSDIFGSWDYGRVLVNGVEVFYVADYHPGCAWTYENISLAAFDGMANVEIVFSLHATTVVNYAGWYIDDIRIGGDATLKDLDREMIEDFEQGPPWPWSPWTGALYKEDAPPILSPVGIDNNIIPPEVDDDNSGENRAGTVSTTAAHDGTYGIIDPSWYYRTDVQLGNAGDKLSCWGRFTGSGRIYLGFAASASGCHSFIAAPNTGNIIIQRNTGYGYTNLVEVPQTWTYNKWYRLEVVFNSPTDVTCNLYDTDGTTLLNTISYSGITGAPGGVAMRSFGGQHIDTIEKPGAAGPGDQEGCASGTVLIEYRIWTEDGGWGNWTTYWDASDPDAGTGPFTFTEACTHYLQYRAVDCLGNTLLCEDDIIILDDIRETELLLEEGFENALFPPTGWEQTIYNSYATFERYTGLTKRDTSLAKDASLEDGKFREPQGSWCACVWWDYYEQDEWLFTTVPVDLSGYTEAYLKFYTYNYDSVSWVEHDYIKISTDGGKDWITLGDMAVDYPNHFWGAEIVYDLEDYLGEEVVVGFHRVTPDGGSGAWGIDHVRIEAGTGGNGGNGGDEEELPITVYNQTHYVDLEPPMSWIELELDHDGNMITPYTEFMIWQEDFACGQPGGSQCCTIHFRIDGPPGSMFYWNGQYFAADGTWKKGDTGTDTPIAFQIRDSTGYIKAGKYVVEYYAKDCLGNVESTIHRHTYYPDNTAPTTTLLFSGPLYHDGYDWINEDTTISLTSDDHQGSGIMTIKYRIDNGPEKTYTGPFTLSGDGLHTITYYGMDMVNHAEDAQTKTVMLDSSGPDATVSFNGDTHITSSATWITQDTTLDVEGNDDGVGLATIYYRTDSGSWQTYQGSFTLSEGSHVVECYGVDKLGNSGPIGQVAVGMDTSAPSVTYNSPQTSHLYIAGREIMVLPTSMDVDAVIIGPTTISASASDNGVGIQRVELYIDGELRYTSHSGSLEFVWNQRTFLKHKLEVVTVDFFGYTSSKTLDLWVFNL